MKTLNINGVEFEVHHTKHINRYFNAQNYAWNKGQFDIYDVYNRPSRAKVEIFNDWFDWFCMTKEAANLVITSANCQTFSLMAYYIDPETDEILGILHITKEHNNLMMPK